MSTFFSAITSDISNAEYRNRDSVENKTSNLVLKTIAKYGNIAIALFHLKYEKYVKR